jgi:hypothetical protein
VATIFARVRSIKDTVDGFAARVGWDACTGLGAPIGSDILNKLAGGVEVPAAELLAKDPVLGQQVLDHVLLATVDPTGDGENAESEQDRVHLAHPIRPPRPPERLRSSGVELG